MSTVAEPPVGPDSDDSDVAPGRAPHEPEALTLGDLVECYEGGVPAVICTADASGIPNITYLSRVHQVDHERIAISNQFMSKTSHNMAVNPIADLLLINPRTYEEYRLSLRYERTERRGPVFERLRDDVESLAETLGLHGVFRLRAADIHRVTAIERVGRAYPDPSSVDRRSRSLASMADFAERVQRSPDLDCVIEVGIRGLDEMLGFRHVAILLLDDGGRTLYTIASRGFASENIGAEVVVGDGPIGGPIGRCVAQRSTGLRQLSKYGRTIRTSFAEHGDTSRLDVPLPSLPDVNSRIVVPMQALGQLVGGIVVEDPELGAFDASDQACLTLAAATIGAAVELARRLDDVEPDTESDVTVDDPTSARPTTTTGQHRSVRFFEADGSVFLDGDYLIKGVAGRIFRSIIAEHLGSGRTAFTNRELRLDRSLDLPGFKDNLESRLLLLKRRLDERDAPVRITRTGRGRFVVDVDVPLSLTVVDAAP